MSHLPRPRRAAAVFCALALAAGGLMAIQAPVARAVTCEYPAGGDINADGHPELGVGVPNVGGGAVDIFYDRTKPPVRYTAASLGFAASAGGDRFGQAFLIDDLNGDGCSDLIVGAPGANAGAGRLYLAFGGPAGLDPAGGKSIESPAPGAAFGSALSWNLSGGWQPFILAGAPGYDDAGKPDAGAVFLLPVAVSPGTIGTPVPITQDSSGVADSSEAGDAFGSVISGNLVGMPNEDVGSAVDAGAVMRLRVPSLAPLSISGELWTQNSAGVPGVAEAGDRFGAAVSVGYYSVVGVPGEDIGSATDTGMIQVFKQTSQTAAAGFTPYKAYDQSTYGVPGTNEKGDRFGEAVAYGFIESGESGFNLWVGAPGENVGSIVDAGTVTRLPLGGSKLPAAALSSGKGLPGTAEAGDRLGASLGTVGDNYIEEENSSISLLIGVPGEDRGSVKDAGWVIFSKYSFVVAPSSYGLVNPAVAGEKYGQFLTQVA